MLSAFYETFRNLRSNFFQTILSVLGIIIGVGALVAMLAVIDGLEAYATSAVTENSSLENLSVRPKTQRTLDGIVTERDTIVDFTPALIDEMLGALPYEATVSLREDGQSLTRDAAGNSMGVRYQIASLPRTLAEDDTLMAGTFANDPNSRTVLVNEELAKRLLPEGDSVAENAIGRYFYLHGDSLTVSGIFPTPELPVPFKPLLAMVGMEVYRSLPEADPIYPTAVLTFAEVDEVMAAEDTLKGWFDARFPELDEPVEITSQRTYLEILGQGLAIFRVVMGFLIGIAVVVGGVGVMNVLLMSITERTPEIGVRKAVGASRKTIIRQFLAESVAISAIGCFFGMLLGMGVALLAGPIVGLFLEGADFHAVFTLNTLIVVLVVALLIGVLFGTYPARKAAGLDAVEAIRRN